jgi:hypothetical protein
MSEDCCWWSVCWWWERSYSWSSSIVATNFSVTAAMSSFNNVLW